MKKILLFAAMLLSGVVMSAQENEPDFEFEPHLWNATENTMGDLLPCENAYQKAKAGASMFLVGAGKVKSYLYVDGEKSPIELTANDWLIVNTGGKSPLQCVSINQFEVLKSKRRFKNGEMGTFTGASSGNDNSTTFKYKKLGTGSVIIPLEGLEPGEYVMSFTNQNTNSKSQKVYTFRIAAAAAATE